MITKKNYNVGHAKLSDKKIKYEVANEIYFVQKALGNKSTRDKSLITLLQSPAIIVSASGVLSSTRLLSSNPNEVCD